MHKIMRHLCSVIIMALLLSAAGCGSSPETQYEDDSSRIKVKANKTGKKDFSTGTVIINGKWGSGQSQFGADLPAQGALAGPRAFFVDTGDNIYILDQKNKRVQKYDPTGKFIAAVKIPSESADDLAVDEKGNLYILDQFGSKKLYHTDSSGKVLGSYEVTSTPLEPITCVFAEDKSIYIEIMHDKVYLLVKNGQPVPFQENRVPGRKARGLDQYFRAKFRQGQVYVDIVNIKDEPLLEVKLDSPRPVGQILSLDLDREGNIFLGTAITWSTQEVDIKPDLYTVITFDKTGRYLGEADMPPTLWLDIKRPLAVSSEGEIYQMQSDGNMIQIYRWKLDK